MNFMANNKIGYDRTTWHRITNFKKGKGICSICGPVRVQIRVKQNGNIEKKCRNVLKLYQQRTRKLHPQQDKRYNFIPSIEKQHKLIVLARVMKCEICGKKNYYPGSYRLSLDHDHKTGKFRGLLCVNCNTILGNCNDNIKLLRSAIKYLKLTREIDNIKRLLMDDL